MITYYIYIYRYIFDSIVLSTGLSVNKIIFLRLNVEEIQTEAEINC